MVQLKQLKFIRCIFPNQSRHNKINRSTEIGEDRILRVMALKFNKKFLTQNKMQLNSLNFLNALKQ